MDLEAERKTLQVLPGRSWQRTVHKDVQNWEDVAGPCDNVANVQEATLDKTQRVEGETQKVQSGKNRRKIIRVIKKFRKDGEIVAHIEKDTWNDLLLA